MICDVCSEDISSNRSIKCKRCEKNYHPVCVYVTPDSAKSNENWVCPSCWAKTPLHNTNTPVCPSFTPAAIDVTHVNTQSRAYKRMASDSPGRDNLEDSLSIALEIRCLRNEVNALRTEVREFREELMGRVDALEVRVTTVEEKIEQTVSPRLAELETTVGELKLQLNEREQESLLNDVQVSGVPETKGENTTQLLNVLAIKLGVSLDERDVVFVRRVGNVLRDRVEGEDASRHRIIVARLARRTTRDSILNAARVRRNLCTADIELPGASQRIYVNERLTKSNRQLFYMTRQAATRCGWKYSWTRDGRILARKEEGKSVVQVRMQSDIERFFPVK